MNWLRIEPHCPYMENGIFLDKFNEGTEDCPSILQREKKDAAIAALVAERDELREKLDVKREELAYMGNDVSWVVAELEEHVKGKPYTFKHPLARDAVIRDYRSMTGESLMSNEEVVRVWLEGEQG